MQPKMKQLRMKMQVAFNLGILSLLLWLCFRGTDFADGSVGGEFHYRRLVFLQLGQRGQSRSRLGAQGAKGGGGARADEGFFVFQRLYQRRDCRSSFGPNLS